MKTNAADSCPDADVYGGQKAGAQGSFQIQARDIFGNPQDVGGNNFQAVIIGPDGSVIASTVVDNDDGTYDVNYNATKSGRYSVNLALDTDDVCDSPFEAVVYPGSPSATTSYLVCPTVVAVGRTMELSVQAVDVFGNYLIQGGDDYVVLVAGPGVVTPITEDNADGTYSSTLFATEAGNYTATAYLNGVEVLGSPCYLHVQTTDYAPEMAFAYGFSNLYSCDRGPSTFSIQTRDSYGNDLQYGGMTFNFTFVGPSGNYTVDYTVVDNDDGTYDVTWSSPVSGSYYIYISSKGVPLAGSPYFATLRTGSSSPVYSYAFGPGLSGVQGNEKHHYMIFIH